MFADPKYIQTNLISQLDRFEQLAEMSCGVDCAAGRVNRCRYETIYADLHQWPPMLFSPAASSTRLPTR